MKKYLFLLSAFAITAIALSSLDLTLFQSPTPQETETVLAVQTEKQAQQVSVSIAFPDESISHTLAYTQDMTAFSALEAIEGVEPQTKHYDFGVFIEAINDSISSSEAAWIYYINGKSGMIAADQAELNPGGFVEWKYEEVTYE